MFTKTFAKCPQPRAALLLVPRFAYNLTLHKEEKMWKENPIVSNIRFPIIQATMAGVAISRSS
jgi:hypothetical protein